MPYTINKYNGEELVVLEDGTINTTTSLGLVGRNYVGYGETQNENFVFLLENFANDRPPARPLTGQTWFNSDINALNVYTGSDWSPIGNAELSATEPVASSTGSLWLRTTDNSLHVWDGTQWKFIGPEGVPGFGTTRARSTTLLDSLGTRRPVILFEVNDAVIAVGSSADFSVSTLEPLAGFVDIAPGITMSNLTYIRGNLRGTADRAQRLDVDRKINGTIFNGTSDITIKAGTPFSLQKGEYIVGANFDGTAATSWSVDATPANVIGKVVARNSEGGFSAGTITANFVGNLTGNVTSTTGTSKFNIVEANQFIGATLSGNAFSATKLQNSRTINGVEFDGTSNITVSAAAGTLTGDTLNSTVTKSSLVVVGHLETLRVVGKLEVGTGPNFSISASTSSPVVNTTYNNLTVSAGTGTGATGITVWNKERSLSEGGTGNGSLVSFGTGNQDIGHVNKKWENIWVNNVKGNADTATLADRAENIDGGAIGALPYQLSTGVTGMLPIGVPGQILKVTGGSVPAWQDLIYEDLNSGSYVVFKNNSNIVIPAFNGAIETTMSVDATTTNTPNKIVARDADGNFRANTITANLTGNVTGTVTGSLIGNANTATQLRTARLINGVSFDGTKDIEIPNYIKAWVKFRGASGSILKSYNVTSVVRTAPGRYTINIQPGVFSNNQFAVAGSASDIDHVVATPANFIGAASTINQLLVTTVDLGGANDTTSDSVEVSVIMVGTPYVAGEASIVEAVGQTQYLTAGTYSFTVPVGVEFISVAAIGGGGGGGNVGSGYGGSGGSGGACAYANDIPVTSGEVLSIVVGAGGTPATNGGDTRIARGATTILTAGGGRGGNGTGATVAGGTYSVNAALVDGSYGGWNGGFGGVSYGGTGQRGGNGTGSGYIGSAGGGSGGHTGGPNEQDGGTGAVGAIGGGLGGDNTTHSGAGGGGGALSQGYPGFNGLLGNGSTGGVGGRYGGGGGGGSHGGSQGGAGAAGAIRIIWGSFRQFPSTTTQDL